MQGAGDQIEQSLVPVAVLPGGHLGRQPRQGPVDLLQEQPPLALVPPEGADDEPDEMPSSLGGEPMPATERRQDANGIHGWGCAWEPRPGKVIPETGPLA